jgi:hypothetical protein
MKTKSEIKEAYERYIDNKKQLDKQICKITELQNVCFNEFLIECQSIVEKSPFSFISNPFKSLELEGMDLESLEEMYG